MVIKKFKVHNVEHEINPDLPDYTIPEGTLEITENCEIDILALMNEGKLPEKIVVKITTE